MILIEIYLTSWLEIIKHEGENSIFKKHWNIIIIIVISIVFLSIWKFYYNLTMNIDYILSLLTAYSAILAAIFTIYSGFKKSAKSDVILASDGKEFKINKTEFFELEKENNVLIFPLELFNKGNATTNKIHIDIKFKTPVEFHTITVPNQENFNRDGTYHLFSWVNQEIWPKTTIVLGEEGWIYIYPDEISIIKFNWEVRTADSQRKGKVQIQLL